MKTNDKYIALANAGRRGFVAGWAAAPSVVKALQAAGYAASITGEGYSEDGGRYCNIRIAATA